MTLKVLDGGRAQKLEALCERIVPGSNRIGPVVYIDAVLAKMPASAQEAARGAIDRLAAADRLQEHERTPEFAFIRALAIEAYYSDFVAPGKAGPGAWSEIDFQPPRAADLERDWSYLGIQS